MELYSLNGQYPTELPERLRMPDGMTRRPPYTPEDLEEVGWEGPYETPVFNSATQRLDWDNSLKTFLVTAIPISPDTLLDRLKSSFSLLEDLMLDSPVYAKVKLAAVEDPRALVACVEFLNLFSLAAQDPNKAIRVQQALDRLVAAAGLTIEDQQVIDAMLAAVQLDDVISLGTSPISIPEDTDSTFVFNECWITIEGAYTGPASNSACSMAQISQEQ